MYKPITKEIQYYVGKQLIQTQFSLLGGTRADPPHIYIYIN